MLLCIAGKVVDVKRATTEGFAKGHLHVEGTGEYHGRQLHIDFQNENLIASSDGEIVASVPDLICCLESASTCPAWYSLE